MKLYKGSCHCKAVQFEVHLDLDNSITCNCSHCEMKGVILKFVPASQFTVLQGENEMTDYQFNKKTIHHLFCKHCGVESFARGIGPDGSQMVAVNLRCLEGVDLSQLKSTMFNGRDL